MGVMEKEPGSAGVVGSGFPSLLRNVDTHRLEEGVQLTEMSTAFISRRTAHPQQWAANP